MSHGLPELTERLSNLGHVKVTARHIGAWLAEKTRGYRMESTCYVTTTEKYPARSAAAQQLHFTAIPIHESATALSPHVM